MEDLKYFLFYKVAFWLEIGSFYIIAVGSIFIIFRLFMYKIQRNSAVSSYFLWMLFPLGFFLLVGIIYSTSPDTFGAIEFSKLSGKEQTSLMLSSLKVQNNNFTWRGLIALLWMVGTLFFVVKLIYKYRQMKKYLLKNSQHCNDNIYLCRSLSTPLAFGLLKPRVFMPHGYKQIFTETQQDLLIKHEEVHCKRYDPAMRIFYKIIEAIFWFHPLIYFINKLMKKDQEISCDHLVLAKSGHNVEYSKLLLHLNQNNMNETNNNNQQNLSELYCSSISILKERIMSIKTLKSKNTMTHQIVNISILLCAITGLVVTTAALAHIKEPLSIKGMSFEMVPKKDIKPQAPVMPVMERKLLRDKAPRYPTFAYNKGITGYVNMEYEVSPEGRVKNVVVLESQPKGVFDYEAIKSVKKYQYAIGSQTTKTQQKITFKLSN